MPINILYHDVTAMGEENTSGFSGPEATRYKLTVDDFAQHLEALALSTSRSPVTTPSAIIAATERATAWTLTFDDGGVSSATVIADLLESRGWRGWFFIPTDFIGQSRFCTADEIRGLDQRGHVVGSHSCSHPERFSSCTWDQMLDEWIRSCRILAEILGRPVDIASVPGGFYSLRVARAAAAANVKMLFNSEPTTAVRRIGKCLVVGRYSIHRGMRPADAKSLMNSSLTRGIHTAYWNIKKAAKTFAAPIYKAVRKRILHRVHAGQEN